GLVEFQPPPVAGLGQRGVTAGLVDGAFLAGEGRVEADAVDLVPSGEPRGAGGVQPLQQRAHRSQHLGRRPAEELERGLVPREPAVSGVVGQDGPVEDVDGAEQAVRAAGATAVVSFGGGSPVDSAELVAIGLGGGMHIAGPTALAAAELAAGAGMTDAYGNKVG